MERILETRPSEFPRVTDSVVPSSLGLQIAVKRMEAKSKGEKERYTHLNAEFQRIARRDKEIKR